MTTTLTLIRTIKIDTRRNGEISFAKVEAVIDGVPTVTDFRARVGEEAIVIDGETITVSDAQVEGTRRAIAHSNATRADHAARVAAALDLEIAKLDSRLDEQNAPAEARRELHDLFRADPEATISLSYSPATRQFRSAYTAILARYNLA